MLTGPVFILVITGKTGSYFAASYFNLAAKYGGR